VQKALEARLDLSRTKVASRITRLLSHPNAEIRAAALRQYIAHGTQSDVLDRSVEDASAAVRVTAFVGLARLGATDERRVTAELERVVAGNDPSALRALARSAGLLPARTWQAFSLRIADGPDAVAAALLSDAIAEAPDAAHLPVLIALLARREARAKARKALVTLGAPALGALARALEDPATPAAIRIHVPRTISRFHEPEAAAALQRAFAARPDDAVGFKILRALGRLRSDEPGLPIDREPLERAALRTIERAVAMLCWRRAVEIARRHLPGGDDACAELLSKVLAEESGRALERTFRVMHILRPNCAFHVMFVATKSGDPDVRARGREMLELLAPASLKRALRAVLDDAPTSTRLQRPMGFRLPPECLRALRLVRPRGKPSPSFEQEALATLTECLARVARHPNPLLRSLVARYARTLELTGTGAIHAQ
jgi:AAA family ATP:ADP antiporter